MYANVFARPSDETFRPYWPDSYSRATLDRYFDLAAHMLEVGPVQVDPATGDVPVRTRAMEDLVERMDRAAGTVRPKLAVRFSADPNVPLVNRHGVLQHGCTFVGECVIGCNQGAKNSLDYNYLAVAERAGAVAVTGPKCCAALALVGTKRQHRLNPLRLWSDLTTLYIEAADSVGRLHITSVGTLKLVTSIRGDAFTSGKRAAAIGRFLMYFTRGAIRGIARQ